MSVNLSRRWFLIGSAAGIAASQISILKAAARLGEPRPAISAGLFDEVVSINYMMFSPENRTQEVVTLRVGREGGNLDLFYYRISSLGRFVWSTWNPMEEIVSMPSRPLRFEVTPDIDGATIELGYRRASSEGSALLVWKNGQQQPTKTYSLIA